jgi:hypothetical protein
MRLRKQQTKMEGQLWGSVNSVTLKRLFQFGSAKPCSEEAPGEVRFLQITAGSRVP